MARSKPAMDHGEMLGDHGRWGKACARERVCRIPFLIRLPERASGCRAIRCGLSVALSDVRPTIPGAAGVSILDAVEGGSLVLALRGEILARREWVHGEINMPEAGWQFLTDGRKKYVEDRLKGRDQYISICPRTSANFTTAQRMPMAATA